MNEQPIVTTRKTGNSVSITLKKIKKVHQSGEKYYYFEDESGTITLVPLIEDPFLVAEEGEFYQPSLDSQDAFEGDLI